MHGYNENYEKFIFLFWIKREESTVLKKKKTQLMAEGFFNVLTIKKKQNNYKLRRILNIDWNIILG